MGQRMSSRLTSSNSGEGWRGRLFHATTGTGNASPPKLVSSEGSSRGSSEAGDSEGHTAARRHSVSSRRPRGSYRDFTDVGTTVGSTVSVQDAVGNFMRGVKGGWTFSSSSSSSAARPSIFAPQVSPRSRTPVPVIAEQIAAEPQTSMTLPPPMAGTRVMLSFGGLGD